MQLCTVRQEAGRARPLVSPEARRLRLRRASRLVLRQPAALPVRRRARGAVLFAFRRPLPLPFGRRARGLVLLPFPGPLPLGPVSTGPVPFSAVVLCTEGASLP